MILQPDNQIRRDRMLRWLRANGVTEPADQIKDGVEADETWITYEVVAAPDGPSRLVRVPHRVHLRDIPLTDDERQARAAELRSQAADLLRRADNLAAEQRLRTPAEFAAAKLDSIDPDDDEGWYVDQAWNGPGGAHHVADSILLDAADPQVADAYRRLVDRCSWWATS